MAQPLDRQIAAAMAKDARASTVSDLIAKLEQEIASCSAERDRLDEISKSAMTEEAEADSAADQVVKLDRKLARLGAKRDQLVERHNELLNSERRRRAEEYKAGVIKRRDALAADLERDWPELEAKLIDLFTRIVMSDAECEPLGVTSAEAIARSVPGNFYGVGPIPRLSKIKIPRFHNPPSNELAWPANMDQAIHDATQRSKQVARG